MAWVEVPGTYHAVSNTHIWEYDNAATAASTYVDANGTTANGIRSFTPPNGTAQEIYVKVRKTGETAERGELSKTYYDARV